LPQEEREKPFLVGLLSVVFLALGLLGLLSLVLFVGAGIPEGMEMSVLLAVVMGIGYIVSGYGLYKGATWGWVLAAAFTILNLIEKIVYSSYLGMLIDAVILVLLFLAARHYGITPFGRAAKPATPVPPPSAPVAVAFADPRKREKRFVKRKCR